MKVGRGNSLLAIMIKSQWSSYEQEVFDCFKSYYPDADIKKDIHIRGRYSKRMRQIDILITEKAPSGPIQIVIDAKLYNRKVNVKTVEEFEGFLNDIGVDKGLLISNKGYSRSALRRAYYCPRNLELDVLDFSELKQWQAFGAIPYVGNNAFLVPAPFGWVVDVTHNRAFLCTMFRRGIDAVTACKSREFLYINCWNRIKDPFTAKELDGFQVKQKRLDGLVLKVSHRATVKRNDAVTSLRCLYVKQYKCLEVTGFIEFKDTIFFAVLLTSIEKQKQNIRRLEHVLQSVIPVQLKKDNTALIAGLKDKLATAGSDEEKAGLLHSIGHWYRDMNKLSEAREHLEASVSLFPTYPGIKELLCLQNDNTEQVMGLICKLLQLDLDNPTVYNDALNTAHAHHLEMDLIKLLKQLADTQPSESIARANCLYYGSQLLGRKDAAQSKKDLLLANDILKKLLPAEHAAFKAIQVSLKCLKPKRKR